MAKWQKRPDSDGIWWAYNHTTKEIVSIMWRWGGLSISFIESSFAITKEDLFKIYSRFFKCVAPELPLIPEWELSEAWSVWPPKPGKYWARDTSQLNIHAVDVSSSEYGTPEVKELFEHRRTSLSVYSCFCPRTIENNDVEEYLKKVENG